jgi:hypothetical protein
LWPVCSGTMHRSEPMIALPRHSCACPVCLFVCLSAIAHSGRRLGSKKGTIYVGSDSSSKVFGLGLGLFRSQYVVVGPPSRGFGSITHQLGIVIFSDSGSSITCKLLVELHDRSSTSLDVDELGPVDLQRQVSHAERLFCCVVNRVNCTTS